MCYFQVHTLIKATYKKTESAVVSRIRKDSNYTRTSNSHSDRRLTCSTGIASLHEQDNIIKPKLHVAEIISIQASERLAEILDPVYETIQTGICNEAYDSIDRSENGSSYASHRHSGDEYYAFTNASSVSIDCQDWIRCVSSPSSSVYNNSLNDYEVRYLERKFPNHQKLQELSLAKERKLNRDKSTEIERYAQNDGIPVNISNTPLGNKNEVGEKDDNVIKEEEEVLQDFESDLRSGIADGEMLDEIMQYMEIQHGEIGPTTVKPELLCPNRKVEDAVVFVDE